MLRKMYVSCFCVAIIASVFSSELPSAIMSPHGNLVRLEDRVAKDLMGGAEAKKICMTDAQACIPDNLGAPPVVGNACPNAATKKFCTQSPTKICPVATTAANQCDKVVPEDCPAIEYHCLPILGQFKWTSVNGFCTKQYKVCAFNP